jgi:hypothetical protein
MNKNGTALTAGQSVRIHSNYGQCLTGTVLKVNRTTVEVASFGKNPISRIHTAPCQRCDDHGTRCFKVACSCGDILRQCACGIDHVTDYRRHYLPISS